MTPTAPLSKSSILKVTLLRRAIVPIFRLHPHMGSKILRESLREREVSSRWAYLRLLAVVLRVVVLRVVVLRFAPATEEVIEHPPFFTRLALRVASAFVCPAFSARVM